MSKIELFNVVFGFVFTVIGLWTAMSWMHKQIYIFKFALKLKRNWDERNIKGSLLECFWRVKDAVVPKKFQK